MKTVLCAAATALLLASTGLASASYVPASRLANASAARAQAHEFAVSPSAGHCEGYTYFGAHDMCETGSGGPSGGLYSTGG